MNQSELKLKIGSMLGPYRITRLIGEGGMGEVYQAHDEVLHRPVALKVISPKIQDVKEIVKRFMSEGQALARLNHQNVVAVYTLGEENGTHYIVMEYVDGSSLHEIVKSRGTLPVDEAIQYFKQLLEGVRALHENGIIHRDIKPKNIIVRKDNSIKIVDFGIAKIDGQNELDLTGTGGMVGSVYYVAPEVVEGQEATVQSDIWSLGINLYEMLIGKNPWESTSWAAVVKKITEQEMRFPRDSRTRVPEGLRRIILKMCEKQAFRRYASIDEVMIALQAFINGEKLSSVTNHGIPERTMLDFPSDVAPQPLPMAFKTVSRGESSGGSQRFFQWGFVLAGLAAGAIWYFNSNNGFPGKGAGSSEKTIIAVSNPTSGKKVWVGPANPIVFDWKDEVGSYSSADLILEIAKDAQFKDLVHREMKAVSPLKFANISDGNYFWRLVQRRDGKNFLVLEPVQFSVVSQTSPKLIYPVGQFLISESQQIKFYWQEKPGVSSYRFQLSASKSFDRLMTDLVITGVQSTPMSLPAGEYHWRVRGEESSTSFTAWSEVRNVKVQRSTTLTEESNAGKTLGEPVKSQPVLVVKPSPVPVPQPSVKPLAKPSANSSKSVESKGLALAMPYVHQTQQTHTLNFRPSTNPRNPASAGSLLNPPILKWNKVPGATSYEAQISTSADFSKVLWQRTVAGDQTKWDGAMPGTFYWRVRAKKSSSAVSEYTPSNSLNLALPAPRVRRKYVHKPIGKEKPAEVSWEAVPAAAGYKVVVSQTEDFGTITLETKATRNTASLAVSQEGVYYFKVAALSRNGENAGDFSKVAVLQIEKPSANGGGEGGPVTVSPSGTSPVPSEPALPGPKLKLPMNGISIVSLTGAPDPISFKWEPIEGVDNYRLEISGDSKFLKILHFEVLQDNQIVLKKAFPKGRVWWRVRGEGSNMRTSWSPASSFEIDN